MDATLLTKRWFDHQGQLTLEYWVRLDQGAGRILIDREPAVFFVEHSIATQNHLRRSRVQLESMDGACVDAVYFKSQRALLNERDRLLEDHGYLVLEGDIRPCDRFLMERFVTGSLQIKGEPKVCDGHVEWLNPKIKPGTKSQDLRILSFDIETVGLTGPVLSVAGTCGEASAVFMHHTRPHESYKILPDEASTIRAFQEWVHQLDPDVVIGWNVIGFDIRVLVERARINGFKLRLGRGSGRTRVREGRGRSGVMADIEGRVVLEGRRTLQASGYYAEQYSLQYTSKALLGEGKAIQATGDPAAEILRMHREDPVSLAHYNLQDCVLVERIFKKQDLLGFVLERQQLTGLAMDRIGGSVAAFDYLYLPRLHRRGRVAKTIDSQQPAEASPGGYVMQASPGLFRNVLVLDFKSLYPSIILTFGVDPLALAKSHEDTNAIEGFRGAKFHRSDPILPALIQDLWAARDEAKSRRDNARSTAIKILMNSFYGVLGTNGCRFFDPKLASSITMRGHQIILASKDAIEKAGYEVIYGDTDSLFVRIGDQHDGPSAQRVGRELTVLINRYWANYCKEEHDLVSRLEMEFETHFTRLLLPTKRGSKQGSKKRYAGLTLHADGATQLVIKGLEAARTDWTPMARAFQTELLRRVFNDELEGLETWIQDEVAAVRAGLRDAELVYTKRIRRPLDAYVSNVPPHIRAAKMLGEAPRRISYVITTRGPQPLGSVNAPLDYEHYVEKQLRPAAESTLQEVDIDFDLLVGVQLRLC